MCELLIFNIVLVTNKNERSKTDHKEIVRNDFHQGFVQSLFFGVEERREETIVSATPGYISSYGKYSISPVQ